MTLTKAVHNQLVTPQMREQYEQEGYFVLERVLTDEQLELLRSGAQYSVDKIEAAMDAAGRRPDRHQRPRQALLQQHDLQGSSRASSVPLQRHHGADLSGGPRRGGVPVLGAVRHQGRRP